MSLNYVVNLVYIMTFFGVLSSCSLETLSTLKFAQRAKFIKNNVCDFSCNIFFSCIYDVVLLLVEDKDFTSTLDALVDAGTHVIVQWEILN